VPSPCPVRPEAHRVVPPPPPPCAVRDALGKAAAVAQAIAATAQSSRERLAAQRATFAGILGLSPPRAVGEGTEGPWPTRLQ